MRNETVTLTNVIEVPPGRESHFEERWMRFKEFLACQRGFVSAALRRNDDPSSPFRFTASTTFRTQDQLWGALQRNEIGDFAFSCPLAHAARPGQAFLRSQPGS
ncbi:MAG: antibiotic biosynthesis monooxygenase [Acidobacteriota bacterium]